MIAAPVPPCQRQAGVAAIELSLTLVLLLMIIFAIVGYGALFWVKQSMNTVAADTARHALLQSYTNPSADSIVTQDAQEYACQAAGQLAVLRAFGDNSAQSACGFAKAQVSGQSDCTSTAAATPYRCLKVSLNLKVDSWPLLNTLHQFAKALSSDADAWVPVDLTTQATVLIAPAPPNP